LLVAQATSLFVNGKTVVTVCPLPSSYMLLFPPRGLTLRYLSSR
jgi:hypothetical protein